MIEIYFRITSLSFNSLKFKKWKLKGFVVYYVCFFSPKDVLKSASDFNSDFLCSKNWSTILLELFLHSPIFALFLLTKEWKANQVLDNDLLIFHQA
jgi:hypothetical protein